MSTALAVKANYPVISPNTVVATLTFSGSYVPGGDTVDLTASKMTDPGLIGLIGPANFLPTQVRINVEYGDGYYAEWIPGTTLANGKIRLWQPGGSEVGAGAYGAPWTTTAVVILNIDLDPEDR